MQKRICIDLNGVLDMYGGWQGEVTWHPPRPGAVQFLRALRCRGYRIVIHTVRPPEEVRAWLRRHGLMDEVDDVTNVKLPAHAYVDDRAVCFRGNFDETLQELDQFRPHWADRPREAPRTAETEGERP